MLTKLSKYAGMRCRAATFLLPIMALLGLAALPAMAGPWARAQGEGFLSFSLQADADARRIVTLPPGPLDGYGSLYAEYGLGGGLTLGAQFGQGDAVEEGVAFLRYTVTEPDATWQFAIDAGLALRSGPGAADRRLLRLGLSVGRGFGASERRRWWWPLAHDSGWATLEVTGHYDLETAEIIAQIEGTLGMAVSDRLRMMLQIKAEDWPGADSFVTVTPGAAYALTERTTLQIGARFGGYDGNRVGLTLGLWHSF